MQNLVDKKFVAEVQSGKRVFGNPGAYIKEKIKAVDKEIQKSEAIKEGEFFMQNKELRAELSALKSKKLALEKSGEYFLSLINKCKDEPWKNAILFCNVCLNKSSMQFDDDDYENVNSFDNNFISNSELSSLMGSSSDPRASSENFYDEDEIYDYVFQTKFGTFFINIRNVTTSDKLPLYVMEGSCSSPKAEIFEISQRSKNFIGDYKLIDLIYNKTGALILKNENWREAEALVLHVKDLKDFVEKECKVNEELDQVERFRHLNFLYSHFTKKDESEFSKDINEKLDN